MSNLNTSPVNNNIAEPMVQELPNLINENENVSEQSNTTVTNPSRARSISNYFSFLRNEKLTNTSKRVNNFLNPLGGCRGVFILSLAVLSIYATIRIIFGRDGIVKHQERCGYTDRMTCTSCVDFVAKNVTEIHHHHGHDGKGKHHLLRALDETQMETMESEDNDRIDNDMDDLDPNSASMNDLVDPNAATMEDTSLSEETKEDKDLHHDHDEDKHKHKGKGKGKGKSSKQLHWSSGSRQACIIGDGPLNVEEDNDKGHGKGHHHHHDGPHEEDKEVVASNIISTDLSTEAAVVNTANTDSDNQLVTTTETTTTTFLAPCHSDLLVQKPTVNQLTCPFYGEDGENVLNTTKHHHGHHHHGGHHGRRGKRHCGRPGSRTVIDKFHNFLDKHFVDLDGHESNEDDDNDSDTDNQKNSIVTVKSNNGNYQVVTYEKPDFSKLQYRKHKPELIFNCRKGDDCRNICHCLHGRMLGAPIWMKVIFASFLGLIGLFSLFVFGRKVYSNYQIRSLRNNRLNNNVISDSSADDIASGNPNDMILLDGVLMKRSEAINTANNNSNQSNLELEDNDSDQITVKIDEASKVTSGYPQVAHGQPVNIVNESFKKITPYSPEA